MASEQDDPCPCGHASATEHNLDALRKNRQLVERMTARIAERDAEIARLRAALVQERRAGRRGGGIVSECKNAANHTPSPEGYVARHAWADAMLKARWSQGRCRDCGTYAIWTPPYQGAPMPNWENNGGTGAALAGGEGHDDG
jgi:hypothetical protein